MNCIAEIEHVFWLGFIFCFLLVLGIGVLHILATRGIGKCREEGRWFRGSRALYMPRKKKPS
ncbi:MAG: hypothetical protein JRJ45_00290 [Deltaproteobacteria bacterium]|nr:hypothetical protein [Deltaproteobacteria bacterium]